MDLNIIHVVTILSILQYAVREPGDTIVVTPELVKHHEEQRRQEMAWLREHMGQRSQELRGPTLGSVLLDAFQHWWFWAAATTLLILFAIYWMPRHGNADWESSSQQGSSIMEEEEEEDGWEDTPNPDDTMGQGSG